jgi:peptide/nickel transport system permease protein
LEILRAILKKMIYSLITIFIIFLIAFIIFRVMPGDPVRMMLRGAGMVSPELLESLKAAYGLDKPLHTQFWIYLSNAFRGDLGWSLMQNRPVTDILIERIPNTLLLLVPSTILAIIIGVTLGTIAAWKRKGKADTTLTAFSLITWSAPTFWLGMILLVIFAGYFPLGGIRTPGEIYPSILEGVWDLLRHLTLPIITLTLLQLGQYSIIMRSSLMDVLVQDYIQTAKAKGLTDTQILQHHAIRNAILPVVSIAAINLAFALAGGIQIETVFSWPGLGKLTYEAVIRRDYPLLQGIFLLFSVVMVFSNLFADILYTYLDPRVR